MLDEIAFLGLVKIMNIILRKNATLLTRLVIRSDQCYFKNADKFSFSWRMNIDWVGSTCQKAISGEYVKEVAYIGVSTAWK